MSKTPSIASLLGSNDNYIMTTKCEYNHYDVFLDEDITEPSGYRDLIALLFGASEDDTVNLMINSEGGIMDTALSIIEGLKNTQAHVTAVLTGACHSAASMIMLNCSEVVVLDSAYAMIHTASYGSIGSTNNVRTHTEFASKMINKLLEDTYMGFLSRDELEQVKVGMELWFDAEQIRARMKQRVKLSI